jgi:hypothetical protein
MAVAASPGASPAREASGAPAHAPLVLGTLILVAVP